MIDDPEIEALVQANPLLLAARVGMDVRAGLGSPVSRLLLEKAEERKNAAIDALIWETDPVKISVARIDAQAACLIGAWISEAIEAGKKAEQEINEGDGIVADDAAGVESDEEEAAGDA